MDIEGSQQSNQKVAITDAQLTSLSLSKGELIYYPHACTTDKVIGSVIVVVNKKNRQILTSRQLSDLQAQRIC